jgi:hypothetical protein
MRFALEIVVEDNAGPVIRMIVDRLDAMRAPDPYEIDRWADDGGPQP